MEVNYLFWIILVTGSIMGRFISEMHNMIRQRHMGNSNEMEKAEYVKHRLGISIMSVMISILLGIIITTVFPEEADIALLTAFLFSFSGDSLIFAISNLLKDWIS